MIFKRLLRATVEDQEISDWYLVGPIMAVLGIALFYCWCIGSWGQYTPGPTGREMAPCESWPTAEEVIEKLGAQRNRHP